MNTKEVAQIALTEDEVEDVLDRWESHINAVLGHTTTTNGRGKLMTMSGLWLETIPHPIDEVQDKIETLNEALKQSLETYREMGQQILRDEFDGFEAEVSIDEFNDLRNRRKDVEKHKETFTGNDYWENEWLRRKEYWKERREQQAAKN